MMVWGGDEGRGVQHGWAELKCEQRKRLLLLILCPNFCLRPRGWVPACMQGSHTDPLDNGLCGYE